MSCGEQGCVRAKGHPSFHTTIEAVARRADGQSIESVIAGAVEAPHRHTPTDTDWKRDTFTPTTEVM